MVHVVKGCHYTVYIGASIAEIEYTSFNASITKVLDSAVQLPNFRSVVAWHTARMMCAMYE